MGNRTKKTYLQKNNFHDKLAEPRHHTHQRISSLKDEKEFGISKQNKLWLYIYRFEF